MFPKTYLHWNQEPSLLDLANDCLHFVIRHFEAISTSSPHIYHSALALAPKKSLVWGLYGSHALPLVRVVQGVPMLWDTHAAITMRPSGIWQVMWSPCNRFIAITWNAGRSVDILDPVTLQQLQTFEGQQ